MRASRRGFFALSMAAASAAGGAVLLRFLWPSEALEPVVTRVPRRDVPGEEERPYVVRLGTFSAAVASVDGEVIALVRKCTYQGCTVSWRDFGGRDPAFFCPCCGSTFARDGTPTFGPARRPLERLPVERHDDGDVFVSLPKNAEVQRAVPR